MYDKLYLLITALLLLVIPISSYAENIDPNNDNSQFAWGENVGWINFEPSSGSGITVTDTAVTGYAWGENIGWINLSPGSGGVANDGTGNLSGYAWAENVGWINFAPNGGGVTIDPVTGIFSGKAWGENIGWINFSVPKAVKTSWTGIVDNCPNDPNKTDPGICGCGVSDDDSDGDGTPDCNDGCPNDAGKTAPGVCGCGIPDVDSDGDGLLDCIDECDNTPAGDIVNADGCSVAELCPCENAWKNHGAYVKCINNTAAVFVGVGLMTEEMKDVIVTEAAESACGKKKKTKRLFNH